MGSSSVLNWMLIISRWHKEELRKKCLIKKICLDMMELNNIYQGDCRKLLKLIDSDSIDLVCSDVAYPVQSVVLFSLVLPYLWVVVLVVSLLARCRFNI